MLLGEVADVLNTNAEFHGVETLKRTLCFKLIASRRELGRPYRAEGLVKTHQLLNAPIDDGNRREWYRHIIWQMQKGMFW